METKGDDSCRTFGSFSPRRRSYRSSCSRSRSQDDENERENNDSPSISQTRMPYFRPHSESVEKENPYVDADRSVPTSYFLSKEEEDDGDHDQLNLSEMEKYGKNPSFRSGLIVLPANEYLEMYSAEEEYEDKIYSPSFEKLNSDKNGDHQLDNNLNPKQRLKNTLSTGENSSDELSFYSSSYHEKNSNRSIYSDVSDYPLSRYSSASSAQKIEENSKEKSSKGSTKSDEFDEGNRRRTNNEKDFYNDKTSDSNGQCRTFSNENRYKTNANINMVFGSDYYDNKVHYKADNHRLKEKSSSFLSLDKMRNQKVRTDHEKVFEYLLKVTHIVRMSIEIQNREITTELAAHLTKSTLRSKLIKMFRKHCKYNYSKCNYPLFSSNFLQYHFDMNNMDKKDDPQNTGNFPFNYSTISFHIDWEQLVGTSNITISNAKYFNNLKNRNGNRNENKKKRSTAPGGLCEDKSLCNQWPTWLTELYPYP